MFSKHLHRLAHILLHTSIERERELRSNDGLLSLAYIEFLKIKEKRTACLSDGKSDVHSCSGVP